MTYTVDRLSYEGPFGVGYAVMAFEAIGPGGKSFAEEILEARKSHVRHTREREDIFVRLAREAIETFLIEDRVIGAAREPYEGVALLETREFGAFVSIKNSRGLRGCIGTYRPTRENLGKEIIHNAIAAATEDPRFDAITEKELGDLIITVDVLHPPRPVKGITKLDPKRYGVIVRSGYKSGLLLPELEGVDTPEEQLRIVLSKAGIKSHESYDLEIFEVERHE
jgi:AmmeMemoRadiSam system protein A